MIRMSKRITMLLLIALAGIMLLAGCGGNNAANSGNGGNATPADPEKIYKANCVTCHGADLRGQNLDTVGSRMSREEIEEKIRKGGGGMIPFEKRLNDAEIDVLSDWLYEMK